MSCKGLKIRGPFFLLHRLVALSEPGKQLTFVGWQDIHRTMNHLRFAWRQATNAKVSISLSGGLRFRDGSVTRGILHLAHPQQGGRGNEYRAVGSDHYSNEQCKSESVNSLPTEYEEDQDHKQRSQRG